MENTFQLSSDIFIYDSLKNVSLLYFGNITYPQLTSTCLHIAHLLSTSINHTCLECLCRNFPQGTIGDMVTDASQGISFICNNIAEYGGDPNRWYNSFFCSFMSLLFLKLFPWFLLACYLIRIYLMGQSAGAHISACVLLDQAIREAKGEESISWSVSQIKAYFGLSGG